MTRASLNAAALALAGVLLAPGTTGAATKCDPDGCAEEGSEDYTE
jgi:hypothetical protein